MKYAYYPGCSLTGTAVEYDTSTRALMHELGAEITEIPDWTCCGASAAPAVSDLLAHALPARNLALAERDVPGCDVLVPCSACYLNLMAASEAPRRDRVLADNVRAVLEADGLSWDNTANVRHLLDVLANDVKADTIAQRVTHSLEGFVLAPYYGCQTLRPYAAFDDPERPTTMTPLLTATGAEALDWDLGARCCGASLSTTHRSAALPRIRDILEAAKGADAIVTVCPMCQMNLESFQKDAGLPEPRTILYLPQLIGLALGLSERQLLLDKNLSVTSGFMKKFKAGPPPSEDDSGETETGAAPSEAS